MKLPNGDRAIIDPVKLTDYCLNTDHPRGRHKARLFESILGLTVDDADTLRLALAEAAREQTAESKEADDFGQRYMIEFEMVGPNGVAVVRSGWIVRVDEDEPRFVSCYVVT